MTASSFRNGRVMTAILGIAACLTVGYIVVYPDHILASSLEGLTIWWKIVFPALLPFLIMIELMTALGVMHFIGTWLDPFMRRIFGLPGIAGWCMTIGWAAGSPASAQTIATLRKKGELSRSQAELLMSLCHAGSPVLIVIVIAYGFLGHPGLGWTLVFTHWLAAMIVGIISGVKVRNEKAPAFQSEPSALKLSVAKSPEGLFKSSLHAMHEARIEDGRPFGKLLGDSVIDSIRKLMVIGGYMIFFSVLITIITLSGVGYLIIEGLNDSFNQLGISTPELSRALFSGLFEQHLGAYIFHSVDPDMWTLAAISAIMGWSGLCLHAQVKASASGTDIRYVPFLVFRLLHALTAATIALIIYPWLNIQPESPGFRTYNETVPAWAPWSEQPVSFPMLLDMIRFDLWFGLCIAALLAVFFIFSGIIRKSGSS